MRHSLLLTEFFAGDNEQQMRINNSMPQEFKFRHLKALENCVSIKETELIV